MRRLVAFLVELLPLDATGRRAVDETLADWTHEASTATTAVARVRAGALGVAGVGEVVARVAIADLGRSATYRACGGVLALAILQGLPVMLASALAVQLTARAMPASLAATLAILLLPMALAVSVPLALLTPPYARQASRPAVAVCLLLALFAIANLGWITPHTNQVFREATARHNNQSPPGFQQPRGLAELTAPELLALARNDGYQGQAAMRVLHQRLVLIVMLPVCLVMGEQARRYARARGRRSGATIAWAVTAGVWAVVTLGSPVLAMLLATPYEIAVPRQYQMWLLPFVSLAAASLLAHRARRFEQPTAA